MWSPSAAAPGAVGRSPPLPSAAAAGSAGISDSWGVPALGMVDHPSARGCERSWGNLKPPSMMSRRGFFHALTLPRARGRQGVYEPVGEAIGDEAGGWSGGALDAAESSGGARKSAHS
jgi:hypothetical protein